MWSYFKHKTHTQLLYFSLSLSFTPKHTNPKPSPYRRQAHLISNRKPIGDKRISSAAENPSAAENSCLLSLATSHSKPHSTLSLSRTEVSSKIQPLSFYIYSQTFGSSPIFYHYSHLFIIKPHQSIRNFVFPSFPHNPKPDT